MMHPQALDRVHRRRPFKPCTLHISDGTAYRVAHPEFLWRTPRGGNVFVAIGLESDEVAILDILHITRITTEDTPSHEGGSDRGESGMPAA